MCAVECARTTVEVSWRLDTWNGHVKYSVGVVDTIGITVGDVSNSWGGRVCYSQQTGGGSDCRGGSDGGGGMVSHCRGGSVVSEGRVSRVGQSVIAHSDVGLPDAGERSVDGLGVGGHLSEVSVAPQDVGLLGGDGGGGDGSGCCVSVGGGGSITHSGGPEYTSVGGSHEGGEDQQLEKGKFVDLLMLCVDVCVFGRAACLNLLKTCLNLSAALTQKGVTLH